MSISPLTIYLWQLMDTTRDGLLTLLVFSSIYLFIRLVIYLISLDATSPGRSIGEDRIEIPTRQKHAQESLPGHKRELKIAFILVLIFSLSRSLAPSSNTVAMMVIIPRIAESKVLQQDLPDIYNAAISALKKQLTP